MNADYIVAPDGLTPNGIRELQDALDKLIRDKGLIGKVIVLPPGSTIDRDPRSLGH